MGRRRRAGNRDPHRPLRALPGAGVSHDADDRGPRRGGRGPAGREGPGRSRGRRRDHRALRDQRRPAERRQGGRQGLDRCRRTASDCSPTAPARSPSSGSAARGSADRSPSRTRRRSTTSSSARCARATRGRCSACRPRWYKSPEYRSRMVAAAARGAGRDGARAGRRRARPRLGQLGRGPLHGAAGAPARAPMASMPRSSRALVTRDAMIGVGQPLALARRVDGD